MTFRHNALDDAETYRAAAINRRNRGLPTGKPAAGWIWKRPEPAKGSPGMVVAEIMAVWAWTRGEALEDYRAAVFPERYEQMVDVPF